MLTTEFIFSLIGGLGFFFFGMQFMSDGLRKIAGERLKSVLHFATKVPVIGVIVGTGVTCLIQSSSATTVMVVGFVNAGLLTLTQAISVIMGANIGTTFTAWLVSSMSVFKITTYALPAVGIGFILMKFGKTRKARVSGEIVLGFGMLFIGLGIMKDAFGPLKESELVKSAFVNLSHNPLLGVLVGVIFTVILQSSSATIAIVQVLAFNGLISFPAALPIILGENIGTTITAQLAALGTNLNARRAAMSHTIFNVFGTSYMLIFVYTGLYPKVVDAIIPGAISQVNVMFYIAVAHSMFNVTNTIVFLPFVGWLERMSVWLVPKKKDEVEMGPQYLEKHLLNTPPIALEQARKETVYMLKLANESVSKAVTGFMENDIKAANSISRLEQAVDTLQSEITQYLVELSQRELSKEETEELPVLIHSVNDIERIGDHAENINELTERKYEEKLPFSEEAIVGFNEMWNEVKYMMEDTRMALKSRSAELAKRVLEREHKVNKYQKLLKEGHVERLNKGQCNWKSGVIFVDMVDNIEKIADHLTNIAEGVLGNMRWQVSEKR